MNGMTIIKDGGSLWRENKEELVFFLVSDFVYFFLIQKTAPPKMIC